MAITVLNASAENRVPIAATIGMFDGVHIGHRHILSFLKSEAAKRGLQSCVVTFPLHPQQVLAHNNATKLLMSNDDKLRQLADCGITYAVVLPFNSRLAATSTSDFMQMLHSQFGVRMLVMGFNHHFGCNAPSNFEDYQQLGRQVGIEVLKAPEYTGEYAPVSSSIIRKLIDEGDVATAAHKLGRPFKLSGVVVHGEKNGRKIGFPTANIEPEQSLLVPAGGVYAVMATLADGRRFGAMCNIGTRPTITSSLRRSIEVNIFCFDEDIYGTILTVDFIHRLRSECQFSSLNELAQALAADRQTSVTILNSLNHNI